jgi:membrane-bound serine protease (ClpP class)
MVGEAFEPSFGVLGIGGVIAFVIGSIILMDTDAPGFGIDISLIATFALTSVIMFVFVIGMVIKARRRPIVSGMEELLGSEALVIEDFAEKGRVNIHSENWSALCDTPLQKGQSVKVIAIDGLTLQVEPLDKSKQELEQ